MRALLLLCCFVFCVFGAVDPEVRERNINAAKAFLNRHPAKKRKISTTRSDSDQIMQMIHNIMDTVPVTSEKHARIQKAYDSLTTYSNEHPNEWAKTAKGVLSEMRKKGRVTEGGGGYRPGLHQDMEDKIHDLMRDTPKFAAFKEKLTAKYQPQMERLAKKK